MASFNEILKLLYKSVEEKIIDSSMGDYYDSAFVDGVKYTVIFMIEQLTETEKC